MTRIYVLHSATNRKSCDWKGKRINHAHIIYKVSVLAHVPKASGCVRRQLTDSPPVNHACISPLYWLEFHYSRSLSYFNSIHSRDFRSHLSSTIRHTTSSSNTESVVHISEAYYFKYPPTKLQDISNSMLFSRVLFILGAAVSVVVGESQLNCEKTALKKAGNAGDSLDTCGCLVNASRKYTFCSSSADTPADQKYPYCTLAFYVSDIPGGKYHHPIAIYDENCNMIGHYANLNKTLNRDFSLSSQLPKYVVIKNTGAKMNFFTTTGSTASPKAPTLGSPSRMIGLSVRPRFVSSVADLWGATRWTTWTLRTCRRCLQIT